MKVYLKCIKAAKGDNGKCRESSKAYLGCRMDKFVHLSTVWIDRITDTQYQRIDGES